VKYHPNITLIEILIGHYLETIALFIFKFHYFFVFRSGYFFAIIGGSLKKTEKKITPKVPASRKTYTNVSIKSVL